MKITKVSANNRKRAFIVTAGGRTYELPYSRLEMPPKRANPIAELFVDPELGREAFTYRLVSGQEDSIHLDRVLEYNKDPDYLRRALLYNLTLKAQKLLAASGIAKREVTRRLHTSPAQLYRLLDQTNYSKSLDELVRLLGALDCRVELTVTARAA